MDISFGQVRSRIIDKALEIKHLTSVRCFSYAKKTKGSDDMTVDGHLNFDTGIDTSGFRSDLGELDDLLSRMNGNLSGANVHLGNMDRGIGNVNSAINSLTSGLKKMLKMLATAFSVKLLIDFSRQAIETASDMAEVQNVVDTAFGEMSYKMEEFADTSIKQYGISRLAAKQTGSTYAAMASGMGIALDAATDMSVALTGLSADMASFYNVSQETAATALNSVFTGETETLKKFGIVMTETNLNAFAMSKGISKSVSAMTEAEKVQLRYAYVINATSLAQGDFAKTQSGWANQTRILSEQWKEFAATVGEVLMKVLLPAVQTINQILSQLISYAQAAAKALSEVFGLNTEDSSKGNTTADYGTADVADTSQEVADNYADIADSAEEAEKANKGSLAAFDELNVLSKENTNSTADLELDTANADDIVEDIAAKLAGITTKTYTIDVDTSSAENNVTILFETIKSVWERFKILCEPLQTALEDLWETLKQIGSFAGENLLNFYEHFLKPLGEWTLGTGLPKLVEILDTTLQNIDFEKINQAYDNLYKALEPFAEHVGEGLLWFCENVLSPLATWYYSYILPAFLNILASAIKILDTIIEDAKVPLGWLWENFLEPAAEWAGSIIASVLEGIALALKKISESDVAISALEGLLIAIATFAGLSKLVGLVSVLFDFKKRLALIQKILGALQKAWAAFSTVLLANPIVLLISILVGLIATFVILWNKCEWFRDFYINLWNKIKETTSNVCSAIAGFFTEAWENIKSAFATVKDFFIGIWNSIKSVFTTVAQWVDENVIQPIVAFFTPIIDFFASIFAVIVELTEGCVNVVLILVGVIKYWIYEHVIIPVTEFFTVMWETVSSKASEMWEKIKTVFGAIFGWINEKIIEPIKNAFKAMWEKVKSGASEAWDGIKSVFSKVAEFFKETFTKAWTKVKEIFSKGGEIFSGIKDGILYAFKSIVNTLIDGINTIVAIPFEGINNALDRIHDIRLFGQQPFEGLISRINIPQIPRLATGTVIPANYGEFAAILGDNKRETEVVSPLSTMKQAVIEALAEVGLTGGNNGGDIVINIDGREIFRVTKKEADKYKRMHGKPAFG